MYVGPESCPPLHVCHKSLTNLILYIFSNLYKGLTDRLYLVGVEILNSRSANFSFYILWHYSTVYNCVALYLNDYQLLMTRNETKSI